MCTERWVTVKRKNDRLVPCLHCYFSIRNQTCQKVEIAVVWLWFGRERGMLGQFLLQLKAVEPSRSTSRSGILSSTVDQVLDSMGKHFEVDASSFKGQKAKHRVPSGCQRGPGSTDV